MEDPLSIAKSDRGVMLGLHAVVVFCLLLGIFHVAHLVVSFPLTRVKGKSKQTYVAFILKDLAAALLTSSLAFSAIRKIWYTIDWTWSCADLGDNVMTIRLPDIAIAAGGCALGHFACNCWYILWHFSALEKEADNMTLVLTFLHNVACSVFWSYGLLADRSALFILGCMCMEVTNVGCSLFCLVRKLEFASGEAYVRVLWVALLAVARIMPMPWFGQAYVHLHFSQPSCGFHRQEWTLSMLMVPVSFLVPLVSFHKMYTSKKITSGSSDFLQDKQERKKKQ